MRFILLFILSFSTVALFAQNLVTNSNFENTTGGYTCGSTLPNGYYQIVNGWFNAANFNNSTGGSSSDKYCSSSSLVPPNPTSGVQSLGFSGGAIFGTNTFSEAVTTNLTSTIASGSTATVSFQAKMHVGNSTPDPNVVLGAYFYSTANVPEASTGLNQHLTATPQIIIPTTSLILNSWVSVSGSATIPLNATRVAIGFFNPNSDNVIESKYVVIDDVVVTAVNPCPPAPTGIGGSSNICQGNAFTFPTRSCSSGTLRWYPNSTGSGGTFYTGASVSPSSTTTYYPFCYTTCLSPAAGASATATVTVPSSAANNTTSTAAICESTTKALTGSPSGGTWSIVSGGGTISGSTYTPANISSNTNVTIRYTIAANGPCPATTDNVSFTVNPNLGAANNTTSTAAICESSTKALTGTPSGGSWSIISGGGTLSGSTYTPANITSNTNVIIRYTIAANGACPVTTDDVTFTVNPNLNPASNTTSTAAICESSTKALTGTPSGGSWLIVSGGGIISGSTYTPANITSNTNVTIRYTVAASGACPATTDDVTFTVNPNLGTANNTTSTAAICESSTKALTGTPSGGSWSIISGGGTISGSTYSPSNITSNTNITIQYAIGASGACPTTTDNVTFIVNPSPDIIISNDTTICLGTQINLSASGGTAYLWSSGATSNSISVAPTTNTTYFVTVTDANSCAAVDSVEISLQSGVNVNALDDNVTASSGQLTRIDATLNDVGSNANIQIVSNSSFGNSMIAGNDIVYTSITGYTGFDTIEYAICDGFCIAICDTAFIYITINEELFIPQFISPNGDGLNDVFEIKGLANYPNNELKIFNRWGTLLYDVTPYANEWNASQNMDKKDLEHTSGTYFYVLSLGNGSEPITGYIQVRR